MPGPVTRQGVRAVKTVAPGMSDHGRRVAEWSELLLGAGVRTPRAVYDADSECLLFDWIDGRTGREVLEWMQRDSPDGPRSPTLTRFLGDALGPLIHLHAVSPTGLGVPPLDPWRRIRPRLSAGSAVDPWLRRRARRVLPRLRDAVRRRGAGTSTLVHGDFHVGQLRFEPTNPEPWLLDLDDLASGPPESDLANFVAHLATSGVLAPDMPHAAYEWLEPEVMSIYAEISGRSVNVPALRAHAGIAFLRRGLKLSERGDPAAMAAAAIAAAGWLLSRIG